MANPLQLKAAAFFGTWELVPEASKFEFDNPPKKATLSIKPDPKGLFMRAEWLDPKSKKGEVEHELVFNQPVLVNGVEVTLSLRDGEGLETVVAREGAELSRTLRTLSKDGKTMELTQTGQLPGAKTFKNVSTYRKVP